MSIFMYIHIHPHSDTHIEGRYRGTFKLVLEIDMLDKMLQVINASQNIPLETY